MTSFEQSVYEFLRTIPHGRVVTYGQIAKALGSSTLSRAVGNALHKNPLPDYYPCYKVVNAQGQLAKHFGLGIEEQKARLENDEIEVKDFRVDLEKYGWK